MMRAISAAACVVALSLAGCSTDGAPGDATSTASEIRVSPESDTIGDVVTRSATEPRPSDTAATTPAEPTADTAAAAAGAAPAAAGDLRVVSVGFEDVADADAELERIAAELDRAGANAVAITAGRIDWTTFPWPGREDRWSAQVRESGRDAIAALGAGRHVSAVVDTFAPRLLEALPELAAHDLYGQPSELQGSLTALTDGSIGDDLVAMIDHVAGTYDVDSIDLTELHYDIVGFGDEDKADYLPWSGRSDWPRLADGQIDLHDASLGEWKSTRVAQFVARAAEAAHRHGAELYVDVRVSWDDLSRNAAEHGQSYDLLLEHADRLVVWNYFGLLGLEAGFTDAVADHLAAIDPDRFVMSVGLWGTVAPTDLEHALHAAAQRGLAGAWVTPASRFERGHWDAIAAAWSAVAG
jgi:hypothetical protein